MKSMTGYGKGIAAKNNFSVIIELKSVNHRFLDLTTKIPRSFLYADDLIKKFITQSFNRGHIDVYFNTEDNREEQKDIDINLSLAKQYYDAAEKLNGLLNIENDFTASMVLRIPDVVTVKEKEENEEEIISLVSNACREAVNNLSLMRTSEGERLSKDLFDKFKILSEDLEKIEAYAPSVKEFYREKLKLRIAEALGTVPYDEARLLNEVAFFSDKSCIDEEVTRLKSHLKEAKSYFSLDEPVGKKFDFLIQEINREINTIGSKSNDTILTALVLNMKNELEKIREQVQNIE